MRLPCDAGTQILFAAVCLCAVRYCGGAWAPAVCEVTALTCAVPEPQDLSRSPQAALRPRGRGLR
eukprot:2199665-Rhodomonas_salina.1